MGMTIYIGKITITFKIKFKFKVSYENNKG
jgi:hypothetical protein